MEVSMRRILAVMTVLLIATAVTAQELYSERLLRAFNLDDEQIDRILTIDAETETELRVLHADLEIKKAELARLLIDEEPNMRLVERNLNDTASIEVRIRLAEIRRELSIRSVVGIDRWTRIMHTLRVRREEQEMQRALNEAREGIPEEVGDQLRRLLELMRQRQEELLRLLHEHSDVTENPDFREQYRRTQEMVEELQRTIQETIESAIHGEPR
jgi:hypothetical protein